MRLRLVASACLSACLLAPASPGAAQGGEDAAAWANPLVETLAELGGEPCEDAPLTCVTIAVPRDHDGDPGRTIDVTFGVSLATEESAGLLLYAVGGPGGSGLAAAEPYLAGHDPALVAGLDIAFFDQRGVGPATGIACPLAQGAFDAADLDLGAADRTLATVRGYVADCLAETDHADLLPVVGTDQAIRDVEAFRQALGAPPIWVYGESYGTQLAQAYAAAYPQAVRGVVLDGTVDLTLGFADYYRSYSDASERILARLLAACDAMPDCAADMGGPAAEAYDALAARLARGPAEVALPLGSGEAATRPLTAAMLEASAFYALYAPADRATFLRALAAAARDDLVPLLRLSYANLLIDAESGEGVADPSWYGAAYFAVTCADYAEGSGDADADARAVLADARARAATGLRLPRTYASDRLVCALWPERGEAARPAPFAGGDYPTLVLNADTDPITPASMAYAVFDAVRNGSLIVMQGGPHVIWGWGLGCPDATVSALLLEGTTPPGPVQLCEQPFVEGYVPLTLTEPALAADPLEVARAVAVELAAFPELAAWDYAEDLALGCDHGGTLTASAGEAETTYALAACALWPGLVVDGAATWLAEGSLADGLSLRVAVSGSQEGEVAYARGDVTEAEALGGTWNGAPVGTPRPLP